MVMLSSPHVHTNLVDGKSPARDVIEAAIAAGFYSIGFSEHARQPFDQIYGMTSEQEKQYISLIKELSDSYKGRLIIALGLERDEYSLCDRRNYTYIIGSKHYIAANDYSDFFAVDSDDKTVREGCDRFFKGDWYALCDRYFEELSSYICAFKPEIMGHFDLVSKLNEKNGYYDECDSHYLESGFKALDKMAEVSPLLEINTGAMARGYRTSPYPSPAFLRHWREVGGRVILSTDCHDAKKIDYGLEDARKLALNAGYDTAWRICSVNGEFEPYKL